MRYLNVIVFLGLFAASSLPRASAQTEVTLLAPNPIKEPLEKVIEGFESKTGDKVAATYVGALAAKEQVTKGEPLDVSIMFSPFPEAISSGSILRKSATTIATLQLVIAVRKGSPKPMISSSAEVKRTLLAASSIACVDPTRGSAGMAAIEVLNKLGIADKVKDKIKIYATGVLVQEAVAKGEEEIALGPYLNDIQNPGVDVAGTLPSSISSPIKVVGFVSAHAKDKAAASALLKYLSSREVASIYQAARMRPSR